MTTYTFVKYHAVIHNIINHLRANEFVDMNNNTKNDIKFYVIQLLFWLHSFVQTHGLQNNKTT